MQWWDSLKQDWQLKLPCNITINFVSTLLLTCLRHLESTLLSYSILSVLWNERSFTNGKGRACVVCMGKKQSAYKIWVGEPEGKESLGRPWSRWEDTIKWILEKYDGRIRTGFIWLRIGASVRLLWIL
jgi:hypothetical protein